MYLFIWFGFTRDRVSLCYTSDCTGFTVTTTTTLPNLRIFKGPNISNISPPCMCLCVCVGCIHIPVFRHTNVSRWSWCHVSSSIAFHLFIESGHHAEPRAHPVQAGIASQLTSGNQLCLQSDRITDLPLTLKFIFKETVSDYVFWELENIK